MDSSPAAAFGASPQIDTCPFGRDPLHEFQVEWPWARPLRAILAFCGYSIDDIVSNPRAATEVRVLWQVRALSLRLDAERKAAGQR